MRRGFVALAVVVSSLAVGVRSPASAHQDACIGQGTLVTSSGLGYPVLTPPKTVGFTMTLAFGLCHPHGFTTTMSGVITGNCQLAVASGVAQGGHSFQMNWTGNTWMMSGPTTYGVGDITPDAFGGSSCLAPSGANRFLITGTWSAPLHPPPPPPPPPPNYPPSSPTQVAPAAGHSFTPADTQQFTIQATDPEGDAYVGRIRVTNTTTNVLAGTYYSTRAASGTPATAIALPPLPAGSYTWVADATDDLAFTGGYGSASAGRGFTVKEPPLPPRWPSDDCAGGTVHEDGFVGGTYTRLHSAPVPGGTAVCFRSESAGLGLGGKVTFSSGSTPAPGVPTVDSNASACATTSGNQVPGPHPVFSGSVGDPADPTTYVPFATDVYVSAATAAFCLTVGTTGSRVVVPVAQTGTPPGVTFELDSPATHLPTPPLNPGSASGACQAATSGAKVEHVNAGTTLGRTWLHSWQESPTRVHLCVRTQGLTTTGGRLTIDGTGTGGPTPVVTTSLTDTSPCTLRVAGIDTPTTVELRRSATIPDTTGTSFCVVAGTTKLRVTLGVSGSATPPQATWTADT